MSKVLCTRCMLVSMNIDTVHLHVHMCDSMAVRRDIEVLWYTQTVRLASGMLEPSSGSVHVCGLDLALPAQQQQVAALVGICPQHDCLWDCLTGREHVRLYGRIKVRHE